jgi:adenylyltransferase/sulfurtransferase
VAVTIDSSQTTLSNEEILRYSRHLIMPEVTMEGQKKLKAARVLCVGTGGLGSPLALYLTAAGIGTLGLVDFDVVDYTNLQRQVLHSSADVGRLKLDSAIDKLKALNPFVQIKRFDTYLNSQNALQIIKDFDIVADGTDNFATRYLVNDACVLSGKPNVYASILKRHRRGWFHPVRKAAFWACFLDCSASCRPLRSSS